VQDLSILLEPIVPNFASELQKQLGLENPSWDMLGKMPTAGSKVHSGIVLRKLEENAVASLRTQDPLNVLCLKVAVIEDIQEHPNAEKLYVLKLDLGKEKRQLVAGLRPYYKKEELLGKHIIIVANLEYAKLRGVESQGMLLAGDDGKNVKVLEAPNSQGGEIVIAGDKILNSEKKIPYAEFAKIELFAENGQAYAMGKILKTNSGEISAHGLDRRAKVR